MLITSVLRTQGQMDSQNWLSSQPSLGMNSGMARALFQNNRKWMVPEDWHPRLSSGLSLYVCKCTYAVEHTHAPTHMTLTHGHIEQELHNLMGQVKH